MDPNTTNMPPSNTTNMPPSNTTQMPPNGDGDEGEGGCCRVQFGDFNITFNTALYVSLALVMVVFVLCAISAVFCCGRKRNTVESEELGIKKDKKNKKEKKTQNDYVGLTDAVPIDVSSPKKKASLFDKEERPISFNVEDVLTETLRKTVDNYVIDSERLTLHDMIGKGKFGLVYKGTLLDTKLKNPEDVAVKTVQGEDCSKDEVALFLEEAMRMKGFSHENVLSMTGMVLMKNKPFVVLPFMANADLKTYLGIQEKSFVMKQLLTFALNVADGMDYLSDKGFIHRDLAARNCMVDSNDVVKVADFGLSRDLHNNDYYVMSDFSQPLPVKWMALESLVAQKFSTKTDVWSYGVLLYEILTRGAPPYSGMDNVGVITYIRNGKRMEAPGHVAPEIYSICEKCWMENPDDRPYFHMISKELKGLMDDNTSPIKPSSKKNRKNSSSYST